MKTTCLTPALVNTTILMLKSYNEIKADVPSEFLEDNLSQFVEIESEQVTVAELFLQLMKHEKFLEKFISQYYKKTKRVIQTDKYVLIVFLYLILFLASEDQQEFITNLLIKTSVRKASQLTSFLDNESTILTLTKTATCYFDQEYIKDVILGSVLKNNDIFQKMKIIINHERCHNEVPKKKFTVPQHMNVLSHVSKVPRPPCNTAEKEIRHVRANRVPRTTYWKPKTQKKLQEARIKNKQRAMELLRNAQTVSPHLLQPLRPKEPEIPVEFQPTSLVKSKPSPNFKEPEVPVKMNTSSVLRHASRIVKEEEKEIERVKKLTVGAMDFTLFENLYKELKQKEEQEHLQSIEKKHLKGLLTYEEAILAKRTLIQNNKEKRELFEKQKKELENQLKEFKLIEEEKIRQIIQKTQQIQKMVEEKKRNLLNKKQNIVKKISEENRTLMLQLLRERSEELHRKIEMIKEIRTLSSFRKSLRKKEFDDTETMNIGLMSEMSLAELHERLAMLRAEMREELEMRQQRIKKEKVRQQELLREMQSLIAFDRYERKKVNISEQKNNIPLQTDNEISMLRKKLEETREKRKAGLV